MNFYIITKKVYYLLSIGLLSSIALTSCEEDKIINNNIDGGDKSDSELVEYTFAASINQPTVLRDANLPNGVYSWNSGDALTLWNRNSGTGYNFTITSIDGSSTIEANFTGKAAVINGHKLIAVSPRKEVTAFNDLATFVMPEVCVQKTAVAELGATTYMVATGDMVDNKIPALTFSPLTALAQFNLKNTSDVALKIRHITMESDEDIFPGELKIDEKGEVKSLSGMRKKITLDLQEQTLNVDGTLNGYLNLLPTTYGDTQLMKGNTLLTVKVSVLKDDKEQEIILLDDVPVNKLQEKIGLNMDASANQFAAGKKYEMSFDVDYRFKIPAEGYLIDKRGVHIYNKAGLLGWKKVMDQHRGITVTLEKDHIPEGVIDFGNDSWTPIPSFTGIFEGNGVTIKNLSVTKDGFFTLNDGTIQNLNFKDMKFSSDVVAEAGGIVAMNNNIIKNCTIDGITAKVTKPIRFGGLVGQNKIAKIDNCRVINGTFTFTLPAGDTATSASLGGLVGENHGGDGVITNSWVEKVEITHNANSANAANVGGLVGYNNYGKIKGCYSLATMNITCSAQAGALVGVNFNGGAIFASYAAGVIKGNVSNNTGGLIGFNNGSTNLVTACYSTTQISASTTVASKMGAFIGTNSGNANQCYFISTLNNATGSGSTTGIIQVTAGQLNGNKVRSMNIAIEQAEPGFGFNFKVNENIDTKANQPLILQPAVSIPGFGGSDFGDGGDI